MKKSSRALVVALVVVVALAGFNVTIPAGRSAANNWRFVLTHPPILLHVIVATAVLVVAAVALIMSLRSRDRPWIAVSLHSNSKLRYRPACDTIRISQLKVAILHGSLVPVRDHMGSP